MIWQIYLLKLNTDWNNNMYHNILWFNHVQFGPKVGPIDKWDKSGTFSPSQNEQKTDLDLTEPKWTENLSQKSQICPFGANLANLEAKSSIPASVSMLKLRNPSVYFCVSLEPGMSDVG